MLKGISLVPLLHSLTLSSTPKARRKALSHSLRLSQNTLRAKQQKKTRKRERRSCFPFCFSLTREELTFCVAPRSRLRLTLLTLRLRAFSFAFFFLRPADFYLSFWRETREDFFAPGEKERKKEKGEKKNSFFTFPFFLISGPPFSLSLHPPPNRDEYGASNWNSTTTCLPANHRPCSAALALCAAAESPIRT